MKIASVSFLLCISACPKVVAEQPSPASAASSADAGAAPSDRSLDARALDAGLAKPDLCELACPRLKLLGCPEGGERECVAVCRHAETSRVTDLRPDCIAAAGSKAAVRACGTVACP